MNWHAILLIGPILALPLALSAMCIVPSWRRAAFVALPLAPLPGLVAALAAPEGLALALPDLLLDTRLEIAGHGRLFLGFAAFLWACAGIFARAYMKQEAGTGGFLAFWYLTLAGNLGVFISADAASFYLSFAAVSLAAYPLIVHDRTPRAMRAGLVYIVLAMIGESCLLLGFIMAVAGADSLAIADIAIALSSMEGRGITIALLVAGFGLKAGLVPLHVWLPLAHPAAPTPASAVLSGAIVKAGIFGLIQFMPFGAAEPALGQALLWAGLFGTWFAIVVGLTQHEAKTVLAYSTVSQMGIVIAVIGAGLVHGSAAPALAAASLYALHHGLAKGALFMGVGVAAKAGGAAVRPILAALALLALSVAGLPLTGGQLAKLAAKAPFGAGWPEMLVTLSAAGTALLLSRFILVLAGQDRPRHASWPPAVVAAPFLMAGLAALVLPWLLFAAHSGQNPAYALAPANLWTAAWPLLMAAAIFMIARAVRPSPPRIPEGDLLVPATRVMARAAAAWRVLVSGFAPRMPAFGAPLLDAIADRLTVAERHFADWSLAGLLMAAIALAVLAANALAG